MLKVGFFLLAATLMAGGTALAAGQQRPLMVTQQDHSLVEANDCEHFHTQNRTSFPSEAREEDQQDVSLSGIDLVKVRTSEEGGVSIRGWDRPVARLTVCKYAVALNDGQAKKVLNDVSVSFRNGEIVTTGPQTNGTQTWWVHMILRVPKSTNLDVASSNGGIAIRNTTGTITARARNGGISIAHCAGDKKVWTENGGISLERVAGKTEATTENGPISLRLRREDTTVPPIEATTAEAGEIVCNLKGCLDGLGNWNANRTYLRIGQTTTKRPSIKLSTSRAPIVIEQVR